MRPLHKILHIDDDAVMRMMVKKSLERSQKNFEIMTSSNESEFMDALHYFHPDLLMIDVVMPHIDGPSLLRKTRESGFHMPAIFITGQENLELDEPEILAPVMGIMHKPFSPLALGDNLIIMWNEFQIAQN